MQHENLIPGLFKTEFSKIVAVLCKQLGIDHIDAAEDIASDTFLAAAEIWPYKGIPANPAAWLYTVAKNKARNYIKRHNLFSQKIAGVLKTSNNKTEEIDIDLSDENIKDGQLQMLFAISHPAIPVEAQAGLALRILCGFGIDEIANAFLSNKETINKRLTRAKEKLREEKIDICFPASAEMMQRLNAVLITLYLLFNEGYYSENNNTVLREELCNEAMRLTGLLLENEKTDLPDVNALYALMCFHSSRFKARKNSSGEIVLYNEQDAALWDDALIGKGAFYLNKASKGERLSKYHLEAAIAYWHTIKNGGTKKWENILQLYNQLLVLGYSPVAALNRTYALSKVKGNAAAIAEAEKLQLNNNPYYFTLLGELFKDTDKIKAAHNFTKALSLARTPEDKNIIQKQLTGLKNA